MKVGDKFRLGSQVKVVDKTVFYDTIFTIDDIYYNGPYKKVKFSWYHRNICYSTVYNYDTVELFFKNGSWISLTEERKKKLNKINESR